MGFIPDMVRASMDMKYAAHVFHDSILTGNVSVFDHSTYEFVTAPYTYSTTDTLVDNVIDVWGMLDHAYRALMDLASYWWDKGLLGSWHLAIETFLEVKEEFDMVEEWLEDGE